MTSRHRQLPPPEGALVRLAVRGDTWAEGVPPVPDGLDITVSFTESDAALVHADALGQLGYRFVGVQSHALAPAPAADFLIPQPVLESRSTWWRALADQSDRAFSLASGPAAASLAPVLRLHQGTGLRQERRAAAR